MLVPRKRVVLFSNAMKAVFLNVVHECPCPQFFMTLEVYFCGFVNP